MNDREKVSAWLYDAMRANKKTVSDVANLTEICDSRIKAYINCACDFDLVELKKIASCLKVSLPI